MAHAINARVLPIYLAGDARLLAATRAREACQKALPAERGEAE